MNHTNISTLLKDCPLEQKGQMLLRIYYYQKSQQAKLNEQKMNYYEHGHADVWEAHYREIQDIIDDAEKAFLSDYLLMLFASLPPLI
ncbi:hypothetical protein [Hymenobacter sp. BT491]|uniref:hypothetical protein n=1 Tax=Hymenobacter sp. BT491 TaxID=2766779 RepID=UPI001653DA29|nr:hypothetical protein [Hymenobacter sp. BT491]MBC6988544.1 hypothetical protein [Hymenobacter sp. BT491]